MFVCEHLTPTSLCRHQQPRRDQSHLYPLSSPFWCSLHTWLNPMCCHCVSGWLIICAIEQIYLIKSDSETILPLSCQSLGGWTVGQGLMFLNTQEKQCCITSKHLLSQFLRLLIPRTSFKSINNLCTTVEPRLSFSKDNSHICRLLKMTSNTANEIEFSFRHSSPSHQRHHWSINYQCRYIMCQK